MAVAIKMTKNSKTLIFCREDFQEVLKLLLFGILAEQVLLNNDET